MSSTSVSVQNTYWITFRIYVFAARQNVVLDSLLWQQNHTCRMHTWFCCSFLLCL